MKSRALVRRFVGGLGLLLLLIPLLLVTAPGVAAAPFAALTLVNGWANAPFSTSNAGVSVSSGVVTLAGAISTAGTNPAPFTLPKPFRPSSSVYVPIDLCNATKGRLFITNAGVVNVQAAVFSNAQCFTSLEGVSFATKPTGYTALTLQNGWSNAPFGTRNAAAKVIAGVVHLQGAIGSGTGTLAFTLPAGFRPSTTVYVPVDMCNASNGRLVIDTAGNAQVQAETSFSNAQCFTSLEGASFAISPTGYTALTLQNGWTNAPFSTRNAAAKNIGGVVHLQGAIASGTSTVAFTLPASLRPAAAVYIRVDMCGATSGRLIIAASTGTVSVQAESSFANAQCFTSLEGASYDLSAINATMLQNGWANGPFSTGNVAASNISGIVTLTGAMSTSGTNATAFTLPAAYRPTATVYIPLDLCNAHNGRLLVNSSGVAQVQAETAFADAQCFTSLEGASFATSTTGYTALTLQNGWTNAPFGTRNAAAKNIGGIVHLAGAIGSGTSAQAFTLPAGLRPATTVYVPVDMCNATNGRLIIDTAGNVQVQAETSFSNAQCFTSLEGASFALSSALYTPLTLQNGWTNAPFGTRNAAAKSISGIVHFAGAIATSGTNTVAFTLPAALRPVTNVYVKVDLCSAHNGRLLIAATGVVTVQAVDFTQAQCFTSLEGVSFNP
ncbi:MAG: hypothetical protein QOG08_381 [Chloroflexota bacterium]|nr:hypothetical protein [Chloroflexota bacterium]